MWMRCCEDAFLAIIFHLFALTPEVQESVLRCHDAALALCSPQQLPASKGRLLMCSALYRRSSCDSSLFYYTSTCSNRLWDMSLLICSARYSFFALLHLIRTSCVPPNNGIMAGTHWLCWCWVPSGQAPEPWSGNLSLHKCGTVTSARVCWCLLVSTSHPRHGLWRSFRLPGVLIVKYFTQFIAHEDLRRKIFVVAQLSHRNKVLVCSFRLAATFLCALSTFSLYLDELFSDSFHSPNIAC